MSDISIQQALRQAQHALAASSESPRLDSEILLAQVCGKTRSYLRTWPEQVLPPQQAQDFQQLVARRIKGEPIAYLLGRRDFWDMTLKVSPHTLIPRPETECLVELALEKITSDAHWNIADLGTGTGAIALAIARERPNCQVLATDISAAALAVAQENAAQLGVTNIRFKQGTWLEPLSGETFEIIVSNPPYVHPEDPHLEQGDLRFEPPFALRSEPDGLTDIRTIGANARQYLTPPGWLLLEHGYDQGTAVQALLMGLGYHEAKVTKDLAQNERVCAGKWDGN